MQLRGREGVVRAGVTALSEGTAVVLLGPPGAGRTAVLAELARRHQGCRTVAGRDQVPGVPLAVMAPLVAAAELGGVPAIDLYSRLPTRLRDLGVTVLVDDADLLDRGSAVLVAQLVRARVPLAVSATTESAIPHGLRDALATSPTRQLTLSPLGVDEVARIAADRLGEELSLTSLARLVVAGAGLPERITELLAAGCVDARSTPAGVELGPAVLTGTLRVRTAQQLEPLTPAARRAIELVCAAGRLPERALAGPVPADPVALDPPASAGLDEALAAGVLRHAPKARTATVVPADAVLTAAVLDGLGSVRVRQRREEARRLLAAHPGVAACRALAAELALDAGATLAPDLVVEAIDLALAEHRTEDAGRVAARAVDPPARSPAPSPAATLRAPDESPESTGAAAETEFLLARGRAHAAAGDLAAAGRDLGAAAATGRGRLLAAVGAELGLLHAVRRSDPARAVSEVEAIVDRLPAAEANGLRADLVKWRLMAGLPATTDLAITGGTHRVAEAADRIGVAVVAAMVASMDGPVSAAHRIVAEAMAEVASAALVTPHAEDLLRLSDYLATAFEGRLADAEAMAARERDAAVVNGSAAAGMWEYASAELALHTGHLDRSRAWARRAVCHLTWQDFTGLLPTAQALMAALEAHAGRMDSAQEWVSALPEGAEADVKVALHLARVTALQRPADAAQVLAAAGRRAIAESQALLGLLALDEAFTAASSAARRELAAELAEGADRAPLVAALARHAEAVLARDVRAVEAAAAELGAMGHAGRAARAWETAAAWHRDRGAREAARRVDHHRDAVVAPGPDDPTPPAGRLEMLSAREREIATLAPRLRNREIADQLGLSVRTVENHLAHVFTKLGLSGRAELLPLLTPALAPPHHSAPAPPNR